jgi:replicative DNA helicase
LTLIHTRSGQIIDIALNEYLRKGAFFKSRYKLFQPGPVEFEPNAEALPVSPYFLGVWLGDGTKSLHSVQVTKADSEIESACRDEAERFGLKLTVQHQPDKCKAYRLAGHRTGSGANPLLVAMRELMQDGIGIPPQYLKASLRDRYELLAGLLDTDGYHDRSCFEITQKS